MHDVIVSSRYSAIAAPEGRRSVHCQYNAPRSYVVLWVRGVGPWVADGVYEANYAHSLMHTHCVRWPSNASFHCAPVGGDADLTMLRSTARGTVRQWTGV